ncbi:hypothetical protein FFI89_017335 [Bradyrhizobium sp. KBS0727]|uniref:hypothetical protein n=1 Tax=unclassified Bradyrhizobium TaxID=2631580 RepID=UPI00110DB879|nr:MULTISPECIES: hypothetical protein [unclassified Bradyrhizobium]QDW38751.1 hypothetical protein FFI71_017330 [Bradyrhizobium sp. KBS0725]QDW45355.1 hypothetical protein FFI89_017335 [Bradyrhizobium sp. KBS0727]
MARHKLIPLKSSDPLATRLKPGAVVQMSDGWRGRVHHDDGEVVSLIRDGEKMNASFKGHRGLLRRSIKMGGIPMVSRSQVVDLRARKVMGCTVTVIDRARLESEWNSAPGYN